MSCIMWRHTIIYTILIVQYHSSNILKPNDFGSQPFCSILRVTLQFKTLKRQVKGLLIFKQGVRFMSHS